MNKTFQDSWLEFLEQLSSSGVPLIPREDHVSNRPTDDSVLAVDADYLVEEAWSGKMRVYLYGTDSETESLRSKIVDLLLAQGFQVESHPGEKTIMVRVENRTGNWDKKIEW